MKREGKREREREREDDRINVIKQPVLKHELTCLGWRKSDGRRRRGEREREGSKSKENRIDGWLDDWLGIGLYE